MIFLLQVRKSEPAKDGKNGWTKFSLLFPKLTEEEIKAAETIAKRRNILIVDDGETNLTVLGKMSFLKWSQI